MDEIIKVILRKNILNAALVFIGINLRLQIVRTLIFVIYRIRVIGAVV